MRGFQFVLPFYRQSTLSFYLHLHLFSSLSVYLHIHLFSSTLPLTCTVVYPFVLSAKYMRFHTWLRLIVVTAFRFQLISIIYNYVRSVLQVLLFCTCLYTHLWLYLCLPVRGLLYLVGDRFRVCQGSKKPNVHSLWNSRIPRPRGYTQQGKDSSITMRVIVGLLKTKITIGSLYMYIGYHYFHYRMGDELMVGNISQE